MDKDGLSPSPALIDDVVAVDIPVRPMLRLRDGFATDAGGAGVVLGFLTPDSQIDIAVLEDILSVRAKGMDFTFHRAIDYQADGAWETLLALKHPSRHILTAGSPLGVGEGMETLLARAKPTPELILAGSGLKAEFVPRLKQRASGIFILAQQRGSTAALMSPLTRRQWLAGLS